MTDLILGFLADYGIFALKAITIGLLILFVLGGLLSSFSKGKTGKEKEFLKVRNLNKEFLDLKNSLRQEIEEASILKKILKAEKKSQKKEKKEKKAASEELRKRIFVLEFEGDLKASGAENLAQEINAILSVVRKEDEVVAKISSPGGMVNTYGLCAGHLKRLRDREISLTVCVDKVAASGGYLMACMANKIIAAPFSIVGSIGVVAGIPNFHKLLKRNHVDYELHTSGDFKRTLTAFGENTKEGREKFKEQLHATHELFKIFVRDYRSTVDIEKVSTGEFWYGYQAKDLNLVDEVRTSDDYLMEQSKNADLYAVSYEKKLGMIEKIRTGGQSMFSRLISSSPFGE